MTDKKMPADWAIEKALKLCEERDERPGVAFARYIEAHEKPPISRELLCAREAAAHCYPAQRGFIEDGQWDEGAVLIVSQEAIKLYTGGFGEPNG